MLNLLFYSIYPLIYYDEKNRIHIAGTSVLAEHMDIPFLLTAAHVLRGPGNKYEIYVALADKAVRLPGPAFMSKTPTKPRGYDIDIAFFPISDNQGLFDHFNGLKTITLNDFDESIKYVSYQYFIFGFPWRKANFSKKKKLLSPKPLQYFTEPVESKKVFETYNFSMSSHLIVQYQRRKTKNIEGKKVIAPLPHGISGGPLFKALIDGNNHVNTLVFEGILIEYRDNKYVIATRKKEIRNFIEAQMGNSMFFV